MTQKVQVETNVTNIRLRDLLFRYGYPVTGAKPQLRQRVGKMLLPDDAPLADRSLRNHCRDISDG